MNLNDFLQFRSMLSIAHHVPGRIRLKIDPHARLPSVIAILNALEHRLSNTGLLHLRLNPMARSLVVMYDTSRIAPTVFEEFLTTEDTKRATDLAYTIAKFFGVIFQ